MLTRLTPRFVPKVWGSTHLEPWFPDAAEKIGEVWFEGVAEASAADQVPVHHGTACRCRCIPKARPRCGTSWRPSRARKSPRDFASRSPKQRLRDSALSGEIEELLEWHEARPGDTFFIPAGTVHAIGAGLDAVRNPAVVRHHVSLVRLRPSARAASGRRRAREPARSACRAAERSRRRAGVVSILYDAKNFAWMAAVSLQGQT